MILPEWLDKAKDTIPLWIEKISVSGEAGRFHFCLNGLTKAGEKAALGFSCFALRIFYITGLWDKLSSERKEAWIKFLQSFQSLNSSYKGAFIDLPILENCNPWKQKIKQILLGVKGHQNLSPQKAVINAETKQAIATLVQVGSQALYPFQDFPQQPDDIRKYLKGLNWSQPWSAGGQASALATFIKKESPKFLSPADVNQLLKEAVNFFTQSVDKETGTWFSGAKPEHYQLINGAMKVLTALDWLECEIPYPEKLIDTCLSSLPSPEGCHIVDYVYVLYRCTQITNHRCQEVSNYLRNILGMISHHYQSDGAFSYHKTHNQTHYYGAKIARPLRQSDLQATFLLCFAIAMISYVLEIDNLQWKVIKP